MRKTGFSVPRRLAVLLGLVFGILVCCPCAAWAGNVHIVIDPGHGGSQPGASSGGLDEKDVNLKIAFFLREALQDYDDVTVSLTREGDTTLDLGERVSQAVSEQADVLISIHNNAKGDICNYDNGCTVLAAHGNYNSRVTTITQELGVNILYELEQLGLEDQGLLLRTSQSGECYANGEKKDYYGLVRRGVEKDVPIIIVEHSFIDKEENREAYLTTEAGLRSLAEADARGIARYYQLSEKSTQEVLSPLVDREETLVLNTTGHWQDNEISQKLFFEGEAVEVIETEAVEKPEVIESAKPEIPEHPTAVQENKDVVLENPRLKDAADDSVEEPTEVEEPDYSKRKMVGGIVVLVIYCCVLAFLKRKREKV